MATTGAFEDISTEIKDVYPTGTFDGMYNTEAPYRAKLKRNNDYGLSEGIVKFPLKMNGMHSYKIVADNAAFARGKDPAVLKGELKPETFAATVQIGLKTRDAAKSGKSTFNSGGITADRMETTVAELAKYVNIVYAGSNRGRIGVVESDGSSAFVAAQPYGVQLFYENQVLEAYSAHEGGSLRDSFSAHRVTDVNFDTRTVTYVKDSDGTTDDRTLVAGDSVYISGTYAQLPVSMPDIVDDGTIKTTAFTHSRNTYPKLKANVLGNGGVLRNLSEQLILDAIEAPRKRTGKKITRALSNSGQARKYVEFVAADRRYPGATSGDPRYVVGADVEREALQIVAPGVHCSLEVDRDVSPRSVYFLAWDQFFLYEAAPPDWITEKFELIPTDGGHKAGVLGYYGSKENQGCLMPLSCSRLDDLKDPICGDV